MSRRPLRLAWSRVAVIGRAAVAGLVCASALACSQPAPEALPLLGPRVTLAPFLDSLTPAPEGEPPVGYRSLDWPQFDVSAHLDSTGALHVRERQVIRFTGDWNGGERIFNVRFGQRFAFDRLVRVDSMLGVEIPLEGDRSDAVDGYAWFDSRTLRWRSRLPSDVPFDNTYLTYILEYRYLDILARTSEGYVLDHEFAFRDRNGNIERFSLVLTLDSVWQAPSTFTGQWREGRLEPGLSFVVNTPLSYRGLGQPANVAHGADPNVARAFVALLALGLLVLAVRFVRDERALGRFTTVRMDAIDDAWLQRHVFRMLPEVAGTAWDDAVGPPEVAATLARMVSEGTLSSSVTSEGKSIFRRDILHLQLVSRRESLSGHERALVDALFESHKRTTDTASLRERYKTTGFDPAALIRTELKRQLLALPEAGGTAPAVRRWPATMALHGVGLLLFLLAIRTRDVDAMCILIGFGVGLALSVMGYTQSVLWRLRVLRPGWHLVRVFLPVGALVGGLAWLSRQPQFAAGVLTFAALTAFGLAFGKAIIDSARSPHTPDRMLLRKRLVAARQYFQRELASPTPQLEQAWYPYLLAFGLHRQVNKWFKAFGGPEAAVAGTGSRTGMGSSASSAGTESIGGRSWGGFGGGGGFAGAGATVAFGAAVSGFSSGVSAPSSSSSGGSSSSSGGSSGGGGGGGW
jgi:hypothetical protein